MSTHTAPKDPEQLFADNACRVCEEPTSLRELRELDGLCTDCEAEQTARLREEAAEGEFADLAEDRAAPEWDKYQYQEDVEAIRQREEGER